jgi:hypothetical protein
MANPAANPITHPMTPTKCPRINAMTTPQANPITNFNDILLVCGLRAET